LWIIGYAQFSYFLNSFYMVKIFNSSRVNSLESMTETRPSWLISECLAGNEAAIEMLVRQYETGVFRLALSIVGDQAEAHEIMQETFIAALRSLPSYHEKQSFKAWLYTIALNQSRNHLRKRKILERLRTSLTAIFQVENQKQVSPEEAILQSEKEAAIWNSLNQLPEPHRMVLILRYFHELSVTEISEILSVPEGTIHSRLHSAREKLRNVLKGLHGA
jgi:RNA polymerase sigma-70 factor, ECF subfamily